MQELKIKDKVMIKPVRTILFFIYMPPYTSFLSICFHSCQLCPLPILSESFQGGLRLNNHSGTPGIISLSKENSLLGILRSGALMSFSLYPSINLQITDLLLFNVKLKGSLFAKRLSGHPFTF